MARRPRRLFSEWRHRAAKAGALLRQSFHRPAGPEGDQHKNPADTEAETLIGDRLLAAFPGTAFTGEETQSLSGQPDQPDWVVDPHDGTAATKDLIRGGAVSIALVWQGRQVLGVVYALAAPDDTGDLFTWAEDTDPLRRNGAVVERPMPPTGLTPHKVVAVSHEAARCPRAKLLTLRMVLHTLARAFRHSDIGSGYGPFEDAFRSGALNLVMTRLDELAGA